MSVSIAFSSKDDIERNSAPAAAPVADILLVCAAAPALLEEAEVADEEAAGRESSLIVTRFRLWSMS